MSCVRPSTADTLSLYCTLSLDPAKAGGNHMSRNNLGKPREDLAGRSSWVLPSVLRELVSAGEAGLVLDLIDTFEADTASRLRRIGVAATVGDRAALRTEAHNTKGSSLQMGAVGLAAKDLVVAPANGSPRVLQSRLAADGGSYEGITVTTDRIIAPEKRLSTGTSTSPLLSAS